MRGVISAGSLMMLYELGLRWELYSCSYTTNESEPSFHCECNGGRQCVRRHSAGSLMMLHELGLSREADTAAVGKRVWSCFRSEYWQ